MTTFGSRPLRSIAALLLIALAGCSGCNSSGTTTGDNGGGGEVSGGGRRQFLSMGTAPVGGAFPVVGGAIAEVLNAHKDVIDWKVQAKGTKGSQENIRRLQAGDLELALSNAAISYFAVRGEASWDKPYEMRAVVTLAPNVAMFITRADSGIKSIAELKGKRVIVGPAGAGFEMFVEPILQQHGVSWEEITPVNATQSDAVDQLGDGSADAAFLGGAVPTASITQATSTFDVHFVPFDSEARQQLVDKYRFFHPASVPAGTYKGLEANYEGLNVGSMHLITSASQDEELIYQVTKTIWENRAEIAGKHPAGKAINDKNAARDTGIEYHPGAVKFYEEIGIWPEAESSQSPAAEGEVAPVETPAEAEAPAEEAPTTDVAPEAATEGQSESAESESAESESAESESAESESAESPAEPAEAAADDAS